MARCWEPRAIWRPEQAAGELDAINWRTDVYGLGAILYEILTGRAPFTGRDTDDLLRRVREEEPTPPRTLAPSAPAALEAVCRKALAKRPAERYQSAAELADEVRRWLADEPVRAYRDPWSARLGRWARRHRPLVAGVAALLGTAVLALALSTFLIGREQARTQTARVQAEKNFRLARDAVDRYYRRVSNEVLLNEPGFQPLRRDLLAAAREFYERFLAEKADDPELQADLGKAYTQLARITADIGSKPWAVELLQRGMALLEPLTQRSPEVAEYQHALAECQSELGIIYLELGRLDEAATSVGQAIQREDGLVKREPQTNTYRSYLALCYNSLGQIRQKQNQPADAAQATRRAIRTLTPVVEAGPDTDGQATSDLAGFYTNLGILYFGTEQYDRAEKAFDQARDLRAELVKAHADSPDYRNNLASSYDNLGSLYRKTNRLERARTSLNAALKLRQKVVADNPSVTLYQDQLANIYLNIGTLERASNHLPAARDAYEQALKRWQKLALTHPQVPRFQENTGWAAYHLGLVEYETNQPKAALTALNQAVKALKPFVHGPEGQSASVLHHAYWERALVHEKLGQLNDSVADWDRALLVDRGPDTEELLVGRTRTRVRLLVGERKYAGAGAEIDNIAASSERTGAALFSLAQLHALIAAEGVANQRLADQEAQRAVALLSRAQKAGFLQDPANMTRLFGDPLFRPLRNRPDFRALRRAGQR